MRSQKIFLVAVLILCLILTGCNKQEQGKALEETQTTAAMDGTARDTEETSGELTEANSALDHEETNHADETEKNLDYEMRTATYTLGSVAGEITYPYFLGSSPAEREINDRYETFLSIVNTEKEISDLDQRCPLQWGSTLLRFTDITAEVTYNRNGAVSVKETCVVDYGGMHPYHVVSGLIYENDSGKSLVYGDILRGSSKEVEDALYNSLKEAVPNANMQQLETMKEYTGYTLMEEGLCFYFDMGDATDRREVILPFTSDDTYEISVGAEMAADVAVSNNPVLYAEVVQEIMAQPSDVDWPVDCGLLYDMDDNGIEELILLHHAKQDYYGLGEEISCTVCSMYTISEGRVIPLLENKALFSDAGGPTGQIIVGYRNSEIRLVVTGEGGGGGDEWYGNGHWQEYRLDVNSLFQETDITYANHEKIGDDGKWHMVYEDCNASFNGENIPYIQYEEWKSSFEALFSMGTGQKNDGIPLAQLYENLVESS